MEVIKEEKTKSEKFVIVKLKTLMSILESIKKDVLYRDFHLTLNS